MGRWLSVFLLLLIPWAGGAQIYFFEDFESSMTLPPGWTTIDGNGDGYVWEVGETSDLGSNEPPEHGTYYVYYSDDDAGSNAPAGNESLLSPVIDVSSATQIRIVFSWGFHLYGDTRGIAAVRVFSAGSWSDFDTLAVYDEIGCGVDTFVINPAESLQLLFEFQDPQGDWGWAYGIDNIIVENVIPPSKDIAVDSLHFPTLPFCVNSLDTVRAYVRNRSDNPSDSFFVYLAVGGTIVDSVRTALAAFAVDSVDLTWIPQSEGHETLLVFSSLPGDEVPFNDTVLEVVRVYPESTYLAENFESCWPPLGWYIEESGEEGWEWGDGNRPGDPPIFEGQYFARFNSYYTYRDVTEALITYSIDLSTSGNPQLQFLYINENGRDWMTIEYSTDGGGKWRVLDTLRVVSDWTRFKYRLPRSNIILRFVGCSDYGYSNIGLDDVLIAEGPSADVGPVAVKTEPLFIVAGDSITITAKVVNFTNEDTSNVLVMLEIPDDGFASSITVPVIAAQETVEVAFPDEWVPSDTGIYTITVITDLPGDEDHSNDTLMLNVYVWSADYVYAENFETCELPGGWMVIDANGDGTSWQIGYTSDLGSYQPPNWHSCYAYYSDDDAHYAPAGSELLLSPKIDISRYAAVKVYYGWGFRNYHNATRLLVLNRIFSCGSWTDFDTAAIYTVDSCGVDTFVAAGDSLQVLFEFQDLSGTQAWAAGVDNLVVTGFDYVPSPGDVLINEFAPKGHPEWIELHNTLSIPLNITGWLLAVNDGDKDTLEGFIPANGHLVVKTKNVILLDNGDVFYLLADNGETIDAVAFGRFGGAPIAPQGYSVARAPDGANSGNYAVDFTIDPSPTPGEPNDAESPMLGTSVLINECDIYPDGGYDIVELYNPTFDTVVISYLNPATTWYLSDGDGFSEIVIDTFIPPNGFLCLHEDTHWKGFDINSTDVLYLFTPGYVRVDQVGFYGVYGNGSFQRIPDGAGPNDGYDYLSSGGGVTWFMRSPTICGSNTGAEIVYETGFENPSTQDTGFCVINGTGSNPHPWVRSHGFDYYGNDTLPVESIYPASGDSFLVCAEDIRGYDDYEESWWFTLPETGFDLSHKLTAELSFDIWYHTENGQDFVYVLVTDRSLYAPTYYVVAEFTGNSGGWVHQEIDLTAWCGADSATGDLHNDICIAILFLSDSDNDGPGGYGFGAAIDNIKLVTYGTYPLPPIELTAESYHDGVVPLRWSPPPAVLTFVYKGLRFSKNERIGNRSEFEPVKSKVDKRHKDIWAGTISLNVKNPLQRDIERYYIYRKAFGDTAYVLVDSTSEASYSDVTVSNGTWYRYYVVAKYDFDPPNVSNPSNEAIARPGCANEVLVLGEYAGALNDTIYWKTVHEALASCGHTYDDWNIENMGFYPRGVDLEQYDLIIWFSAGFGAADYSSALERITNWLDSKHGKLLLIGRDFAWDFASYGATAEEETLWSRFATEYAGDYSGSCTFLWGVAGDPITDAWATDSLAGDFGGNDYASHAGAATPIFTFGEGSTQDSVAATRYYEPTLKYKTVWAGFDVIDFADQADFNTFICNVLEWFVAPEGPFYTRGDANASGGPPNVVDASYLLANLLPAPHLPCLRAADADANQNVNIVDASYILGHIMPYPNFPDPNWPDSCGNVSTDTLPCDSFPACGWPVKGNKPPTKFPLLFK